MGQDTKIEWAHHTFNPWRGCTKVSPGCEHCYAETLSKRNPKVLGSWGPDGVRVIASESYWRQPLKWNAAAKAAGERHRVFCASLADVFEGRETLPGRSWQAVEGARDRLFALIRDTPSLDWLLLTKRPQHIRGTLRSLSGTATMLDGIHPADCLYPNVWLGTSVENRNALWRISSLVKTEATVHFVSFEPLLDDLGEIERYLGLLHNGWAIVGGESGPHARPMQASWVRSIREQCQTEGVAFFFKQWGEYAPECMHDVDGNNFDHGAPVRMGKKGSGRTLDGIEYNAVPVLS